MTAMDNNGKNSESKSRPGRFKAAFLPWLRTMSCSFVAATLGIMITFGSNAVLNRKKQEKTEQTIKKMALKHICKSLRQLSGNARSLTEADSVFRYFNRLYPDSVAYADTTMANKFCQHISDFNFHISDNTVEKIFSSTGNTWEMVGDEEFLDFAGPAFNVINHMDAIVEQNSKQRFELYKDICCSDEIRSISSNREFAETMMRRKEVREFIMDNTMHTLFLDGAVKELQRLADDYMRKHGITEADLFENPDSIGHTVKADANFK